MLRIFVSVLVLAASAFAQAPKMDTILYGASYYHEYMPYERLEKDVELMQKAGFSVIRHPYAAGADVLTGRAVAKNATVTTGPWDVAIIEER